MGRSKGSEPPPAKDAGAELETLDAGQTDPQEQRTHGPESAVDDNIVTSDPEWEASDEAMGFDAEGEHVTAIDRMEAMAAELELSTVELVTDVRDFLLDTIKARPKPWSATSQQEQRDVASACEHAGRELVRKIVEAVASSGPTPVRMLVTKLAIGSDIVLTGKIKSYGEDEEDQAVKVLHHSIGKHVILNPASVDDYSGNGREAATDPDEPDFSFEAGGEDDGDG